MFLYDYKHKNGRQIKVNNPSREVDKNDQNAERIMTGKTFKLSQ